MATPTTCYPWWYKPLSDLIAQPWAKQVIPSGGAVVNGNLSVTPEAARGVSEAWLRQRLPQVLPLIGGALSLETYTFARYMHSEVGSGTITERVAVGEAALNWAKLTGRSIRQMLLPTGFYGPIHADESACLARGFARGTRQNRCGGTANPRTCCAPFGRWASTARDPSVATLIIAHYVVTGQTGNFNNGAITQWGPEAWINEGQARLDRFVEQAANDNKFWVGPLPGVDPWHTFLVKKRTVLLPGERAFLIQQGKNALKLPRQRPNWPADLPICDRPGVLAQGGMLLALAPLIGLALGGYWFTRRALPPTR